MERLLLLFFTTFVFNCNGYSLIQVTEFPESLAESIIVEGVLFHDCKIRREAYNCTCAVCISDNLNFCLRNTFGVNLSIDVRGSVYHNLHPFGECVYTGNTYTMETTRDFICIVVELTTCMELSKNNFKSTLTFPWMYIYRDTSSIIFHSTYFTILTIFKVYMDIVTETGHGFINGIIQDFVDKMVKTIDTCRTNVHSRSLSYGFQSLQDSNAR